MSSDDPSTNDGGVPISHPEDRDIYKKCHFTCVYCGFDGRTFDGWMQLSIDHVMPRHLGGDDSVENLVVACRSCNSITNRMHIEPNTPWEEIIESKRALVRERRQAFYDEWLNKVAPHFLERPLLSLPECVNQGANKKTAPALPGARG